MLIRVMKFSWPLVAILIIVQLLIDLLANWLQIDFGTDTISTIHNILFCVCILLGFGVYYLREWIWYQFESFREKACDLFPYTAGAVIIILITLLYLCLIGFSGFLVLIEMIFLYILQYTVGYLTAVAKEWAKNREGWWSVLFTE